MSMPSFPCFMLKESHHVSCLKKVIGDKIRVETILLELDEEGKTILDLEVINEKTIF